MPTGGDPPSVILSQSVFNALHGMTYIPSAKAFRDANNNNNYLFVDTGANGPQWFYGTNTEGGANPRGEIPSLTGDVIANGIYNTQTLTVTLNGLNYKLRLERDANGVPIAKAYTV